MTEQSQADAAEAEERAEHLKERIYVTFTALAVVIALGSHAEGTTPRSVAGTLFVTVLGTLVAVFTADFVSHLVVHALLPTRAEFRHMLRVSLGAFSAVILPLVFIGLAGAEVWTWLRRSWHRRSRCWSRWASLASWRSVASGCRSERSWWC